MYIRPIFVAVAFCLLLAVFHVSAQAAPGVLPAPALDLKASADVRWVAPQPDGGAVIGGSWLHSVGGTVLDTAVARIDPSGERDERWPRVSVQPRLTALASGPQGEVYVGGFGIASGGVVRHGIARLDAHTGAIDAQFPELHLTASADSVELLVMDDWLYVSSNFGMQRISLSGRSFDPAWPAKPSNGWLLAARDGRVYVAEFAGDPDRFVLKRIHAGTGLQDPSWGTEVELGDRGSGITAFVVDASGAAYLAGDLRRVGGQPATRLVKLDPTGGTPVVGWNPLPDGDVTSLAVRGDSLHVGGWFSAIGGAERHGLALLALGSGLAEAWRSDVHSHVNAVAMSAAGLWVAGEFDSIGGATRLGVALIDDSGNVVRQTADVAVPGVVEAIEPDGQGGWFVGGHFARAGAATRKGLLRLTSGFELDPDWAPEVMGRVQALAVGSAPGTLYAGGEFRTHEGARNLVRVDPDGNIDPGWRADADAPILTLAADGAVLYVGGRFDSLAGQPLRYLARFLPDSDKPDSTWQPQPDGRVNSLAIDADGSVLAGGRFTHIGAQPHGALVRLDRSTGSAAAGWLPGTYFHEVHTLLPDQAGSLYVSGDPREVGSRGLLRLDVATGSIDTGWQPVDAYRSNALMLSPDTQWLITQVCVQACQLSGIGRYSTEAGVQQPQDGLMLADGDFVGGSVLALAPAPGDTFLVGGTFRGADQGRFQRHGLLGASWDLIFSDGFR